MIGNPLSRTLGFVGSLFHVWAMLPRSTALDDLFDNTIECTDTHSPLPVASQCVMPGKSITAEARVGFGAGVDLGMSLQIMATYEAFVAMIAAELPVAKVCLHVRLDVLLAAELLVATIVTADPLVVSRVRTFDECCNVINGNPSVFDGRVDSWLEVEI